MSLAPGTRLGPYEIVAPLGAGGMGEVYCARDTRLGREVAIKVLPASFSTDPERLRRFEQEARAAGALNHPNILAIYDVGAHEGSPYLVSELLDGETLRERLQSGPLPLRKSLDIAMQVARGMAAAHEKGPPRPETSECFSHLCYAKTQSRVMRRLFQASIHDEDHPERPLIGSGNLLAADVCVP